MSDAFARLLRSPAWRSRRRRVRVLGSRRKTAGAAASSPTSCGTPAGRGRSPTKREGDWRRAGYHAQVEASSHPAAALFRIDGARNPDRRAERRGLEERRARGRKHSARTCSCGPIVQDALFPTVCYVSGPNELAYLAQLRKVYEHFGVPMPLVFPRASATVLDSARRAFSRSTTCPSRRCRRATNRR